MAKRIKITGLFRGNVKDGKFIYDYPSEVERFCAMHEGLEVVHQVSALTDYSEKARMFAFLHAALMPALSIGLAHAGYGDLSPMDAYIVMKNRYAKEPFYDPVEKKEITVLTDFSDEKVSAARLRDFIENIIIFMAKDLGIQAPSSEEYKIKRSMGWSKKVY